MGEATTCRTSPVLDTDLVGLLAELPHRITRSVADVVNVVGRAAARGRPHRVPRGRVAAALPAEFGRIDTVYGRGLDAACRWLTDQPQERPSLEFIPRRWDDGAGPQRFLVELVADSPNRRHSIARQHGAQAGTLLHGLLLVLPGDLFTAGGPGLTVLPFAAETGVAIRAQMTSPVHAAAPATALFTGLAPIARGEVPISALAPDATTLTTALHPDMPAATICVLPVPPAARPLLSAARTFLTLRGTPTNKRLLANGTASSAQ